MKQSMMKFLLIAVVAAGGVLLTAADAQAQWGGQSEQQLQAAAQQYRSQARCGDFWVSYAFSRVTAGGIATGSYCDIRNYNNARWSSLTQLIGLVDCYARRGIPCGNIELSQSLEPTGANVNVVSVINGMRIGHLTFNSGGRLVAAGGGNIVAAGAGNLVAAGGGNIVAAGGGNLVAVGGNLVAAGGGNLVGPDGGTLLPAATAGRLGMTGGYRLLQVQSGTVGLGSMNVPTLRGDDDKVVNVADKLMDVPLPPKKDGGQR